MLNFDFMKSLMSTGVMRGLNEFITDIRNCKDRQSESRRVDEEIGKIREKFLVNKSLDGYQRKKYVCKLLYIYILGYQVDFGHEQSVNLIASSVYSQKFTGYTAASILISEKNADIWKRISHFILADINSGVEVNISLALSMVGSNAPESLVQQMFPPILKMALTNPASHSLNVRKKAMMTLLRIYRKFSDNFGDIRTWAPYLSTSLEVRMAGLGYLTAAVTLLIGLGSIGGADKFIDCQPKVIKILQKLVLHRDCTSDYIFEKVANPWLQIKLLKALQLWNAPQDSSIRTILIECLDRILQGNSKEDSSKITVQLGVNIEAYNLVIHYGKASLPQKMFKAIYNSLNNYLEAEPNVKYLALQFYTKCIQDAKVDDSVCRKALKALAHKDISIRKRALDFVFLLARQENAGTIVEELLSYLQECAELAIKDQLVLKLAILAERFAKNQIWYVDVIVRLLSAGGDFVTDDIWFRIIQLITGFGAYNKQLQSYAAMKLYSCLGMAHANQNLLKIGTFVLSQFLQQARQAGKQPQQILDHIFKHFNNHSSKARKMMITAIAKIAAKTPQLIPKVQLLLQLAFEDIDPQVQQRAVEYEALICQDESIAKRVLERSPPFTEEQQLYNPLLKKLAGNKGKSLVQNKQQQNLIKMQSLTVGGHYLSAHPLYHLAKARLCHNDPLPLPAFTPMNPTVRDLVLKKQGETESFGWKQNYSKGKGEILIMIKQSPDQQINFQITRSNGFQIAVSPIKYDSCPKLIVKAQLSGEIIEPPVAKVSSSKNSYEIVLPIHVNKFIMPVDCPREKFQQFYQEFSQQSKNYHKLDWFSKIQISAQDYLKKLGGFLTNVCCLKVNPHPSLSSLTGLWCCGQTFVKGSIIPIIVQIQSYSKQGQWIRISGRSGSSAILLALNQLIQEFL